MRLDEARLHDVRTVKRHIRAGRVSKDAHQAYVEALPDATDNVMPSDEGGDNDAFEERFAARLQARNGTPRPAEAEAAVPPAAPEIPAAPEVPPMPLLGPGGAPPLQDAAPPVIPPIPPVEAPGMQVPDIATPGLRPQPLHPTGGREDDES